MAASLLDSLTGLITPGMATKAASLLGESDSGIRKGLGATFPVLLSGIANRAGDSGFASSLFNLIQSPANDGSLLNDTGSLLGASSNSPLMSLGGRLLSSVFGGNTGGVANALSSYAGVKSSTASTLMNLAAPLVLAVLGKRVRSDGLNAGSLASLLHSQKDSYAAAVPGQMANIRDYISTESREREYYVPPTTSTATVKRASPWRWVIPALIALAVLWLLFSMLGRDRGTTQTASVPAATAPATAPPATVATAPPVAATVPAANVYFDVDQSAMPAGASTTLASIIGYLNANPGSTAVVSGYHDPTGDRAANEALARERAESVRSALMAAGIPESRIDMQRPMETTGGGTMQDARRVEVKVR